MKTNVLKQEKLCGSTTRPVITKQAIFLNSVGRNPPSFTGRLKPDRRESKCMHSVKTSSCLLRTFLMCLLHVLFSFIPRCMCCHARGPHVITLYLNRAQLREDMSGLHHLLPKRQPIFTLRAFHFVTSAHLVFSPLPMDAAFLMGNRADAFHLSAIMRNRLKKKWSRSGKKEERAGTYCANVNAIKTDARRVG